MSKETLAKNIVRGCTTKNDLRHLDVSIGFVYDANKELFEKYKDRMEKLDSVLHEFTSNPKLFVEKYAEMSQNENVLAIIKKNPHWHKGLEWL